MVRRFISGSLFASAFIWVAVRFFDVDTEVIYVFFVLSVMFVLGLILLGFLFSFVYSWIRRRRQSGGMLDRLPDEDQD